MNENRTDRQGNRWRWATVILGALLALTMTCAISMVWGGMVGFALGRVSAPRRYIHRPAIEHFEFSPFPTLPDPLEPFESGRPWLGIYYEMRETGALVTGVFAGSPAEEAGIETGDVIARVDGRRVNRDLSLGDIIQSYRPGDIVELTILYEGGTRTVRVQLSARMDMPAPVIPDWNG
jgi:membrane-associated protease RseP (regulator of RpoE activity)